MVIVFFGATFLIYAMVFLVPADPIAALGGGKPMSPALIEQLRAQYHLDQPFYVQYFNYIGGVFHLDFGTSFSGQPVFDVMKRAFPVTVNLTLIALVVETIGGVVFGVISGLNKGRWYDTAILIVTLIIIAIPIFVLGFVAQYLLGVKWHLFPVTVGGNLDFYHLILPGFVLGAVSFAYIVRLTRSEVADNLTADYVRTASAKGLRRPRVITVHVLRNSLIPVVTFIGTDVGVLMGGAVVTEGIFNIPGVGGTIYQAVIRGEAPTVVSFVTVLVLIYLVCNIVVDLLYAALDPRIRYA
ncbi:ABC transporter permease [Gordonia sp. 852002-50816_SCH5313054-c]|nr:ABC transporter permease [Gordonia sp. 852002-51296_SCH5728562-b]OBA65402.1 ABC transporter permease [Gordonia sp. 852002-10350_SCH5691597]OBC10599.1 ABC transporter permease [Gordonia sp. 852002-50395_SCH5434458]OBC11336.1 ABC transporter permease [Gordonia sp. 852002-50816_SCH5313054-c]OBC19880.1 ABC transporter permease [Gordonia sp. 852002-50816_SCH5313054-a]